MSNWTTPGGETCDVCNGTGKIPEMYHWINDIDLDIYEYLLTGDEFRIKDIMEALGISRATTMFHVKKLIRAKLAEREDRRFVFISAIRNEELIRKL